MLHNPVQAVHVMTGNLAQSKTDVCLIGTGNDGNGIVHMEKSADSASGLDVSGGSESQNRCTW